MIVGIISDSHGDRFSLKQAVAQAGKIDLWLHGGDFCTDALFLEECSGVKVIAVAGNCDGLNAKSKVEEFITIGDKKIWLSHGHKHRVKYGSEELVEQAQLYGVDIAVYGHTHIVDVSEYGDLLVLNPGSVGRPIYGKSSFIKLTIKTGDVKTEVINIP